MNKVAPWNVSDVCTLENTTQTHCIYIVLLLWPKVINTYQQIYFNEVITIILNAHWFVISNRSKLLSQLFKLFYVLHIMMCSFSLTPNLPVSPTYTQSLSFHGIAYTFGALRMTIVAFLNYICWYVSSVFCSYKKNYLSIYTIFMFMKIVRHHNILTLDMRILVLYIS